MRRDPIHRLLGDRGPHDDGLMFLQARRCERLDRPARRFSQRDGVQNHRVHQTQPRGEQGIEPLPGWFGGRREQDDVRLVAKNVREQSLCLSRISQQQRRFHGSQVFRFHRSVRSVAVPIALDDQGGIAAAKTE